MSLKLDVKMDMKSLSGFLLYHNYVRVAGGFSVLISLGALAGLIVKWDVWMASQKVMLVILALLFTVIQPLMLLYRGSRRLQSEDYQKPFHYEFNEDGIVISQGDLRQESAWRDVRKIVYRKNAIYVYMSTVSAFVLPREQCDGRFEELISLMKERTAK